jgi:rubrerythrin
MGNKTGITLKTFCETNHKEYLLSEWDYETNPFSPEDITFGSQKTVNWICSLNHPFPQKILCRTRQGQGCPFCAGKKLLPGFNDPATRFPEIAADWSMDNELSASQVLSGTNTDAKWKCHICDYEWEAKVHARTGKSHTGCPMCAGAVLVKGKNDLLSQFPEIAKEWDYSCNEKSPDEVFAKTSDRAFWICSMCGYAFPMKIQNRTAQNQGCPRCAKRFQTSFPEQTIYYYAKSVFSDTINGFRSFEIGRFELDIFIPSIRTGIEYDGGRWHKETSLHDKQKYLACRDAGIRLIRVREASLLEEEGIADETIISHYKQGKQLEALADVVTEVSRMLGVSFDVNVFRDSKLIYEGFYRERKERSAGSMFPSLLNEWDGEANKPITLYMLAPSDRNKYQWVCSVCGNSWPASVAKRTKGEGCPKCARQIAGRKTSRAAVQKRGSLAERFPELMKEWDYDKNAGINPYEIASTTDEKYWWRCPNGHPPYPARLADRTYKKSGCPYCSGKLPVVGVNDLKTTNPELMLDWNFEKNGNPEEYKAGSNRPVWWKCHVCGNEWPTPVYIRAKMGRGCKDCRRKRGKTGE